MARFYQTAQRNFVDDFIFQPNMELAAMALQKKDGDIKDQLDTLELMKNLPIDYWKEADQNNVNQIQQEYESRVDEITKQMQSDLMNTGNNRYLINQLRKDVEKDYSSGRIRQIQDNAQAYRQYKTKLEGLTNPADREAYERATSQYIQTTPGGALTSTFKAPELYQTEQYWNNFVASENFKQLEADEGGSVSQNPQGQWIVKRGNSTKELKADKIENAFQGYINSNPNVGGRAEAGAKFFGENNWFDESGQLSFKPGSYLGDQMKAGAKSLAYKSTKSEKTIDENGFAMAKFNSDLAFDKWKKQRAIEQSETKAENTWSPSKDAAFFMNYTPEGKKITEDYHRQRNGFLQSLMTPTQLEAIKNNPKLADRILQDTENKIKANPNLSKMLGTMDMNYQSMYNSNFNSYRKAGISQKEMDKIETYYNSDKFTQSMQMSTGYVNFGNYGGKQYTNKSKSPIRMQELVGTVYNMPGAYKNWKVSAVEPVKNTGMPLDLLKTSDPNRIQGATMNYEVVLKNPNPKAEGDEMYERVPVEFYNPNIVFEVN